MSDENPAERSGFFIGAGLGLVKKRRTKRGEADSSSSAVIGCLRKRNHGGHGGNTGEEGEGEGEFFFFRREPLCPPWLDVLGKEPRGARGNTGEEGEGEFFFFRREPLCPPWFDILGRGTTGGTG